jgi:hypothetical protein
MLVLFTLNFSHPDQIVITDYADINIILYKSQLLNHITITNYDDVNTDVTTILSKS